MSDNTEMALISTALENFDRVAVGLALLEKNYKGVLYEVDTPMGMAHAKAARKAIRDPRYELERIRKEAKAPLLGLGKRLDSEAARITTTLLELENPIHEQIKYEEDRIEKEKLAAAAAEKARADAIQARIDSIRKWPVDATGKTSGEIDNLLQIATDYTITDTDFAERGEEAKGVLMASISALQGIYQARLNQEAEAERIRVGMLELAKLKAEAAERDRLAAEERAVQEKSDQAKRDAETAAQAEANRLERERIATEEAEAKKLRDAETARQNASIAAERKRLADEQAETDRRNEVERRRQAEEAGRITAAREALERDQASARKAAEPKPEPVKPMRTVERPSAAQIIACVAAHWSVSAEVAAKWIQRAKIEMEQAA